MLWAPIFSPDGSKVLVRAVDGGNFVRHVVDIASGFPK
jgi:hypothetical protein